MGALFISKKDFNGDISSWDVSSVTTMTTMFAGATSFNRDISAWKVSALTKMDHMFSGAAAFKQNLEPWKEHFPEGETLSMSNMFANSGVTDLPSWYVQTVKVTGTLTYGAIELEYGTEATSTPQWIGALGAQVVSYSITPADGGELPDGIAVNSKTGVVTATMSARPGSSGDYTVTATGVSPYTGSVESTVKITVNPDSSNDFSYMEQTNLIIAVVGVALAKQDATPAWTLDPVPPVAYSVEPPLPAGVVLDPATGAISATTATSRQLPAEYTITATETAENSDRKYTSVVSILIKERPKLKSELSSIIAAEITSQGTQSPNLVLIDTSEIIDMGALFINKKDFNGDISSWDVSSVTTMTTMFAGATSFNRDISAWKVRALTKMDHMFSGAAAFKQNLEPWKEHFPEGETLSMSNMFANSGVTDLPSWYKQ